MRTTTKLTALVVLLATGVACRSVITGNEGNFRFSYFADERFFDFNKAIAVGASLDIDVTDAGDDAPILLSDATTDDPDVLEATLGTRNQLTVTAVGEGNTLIRVEGAREGGETETDSVNMRALVPEVHELRHTCRNFNGIDASEYAYLTGQPVYVPFDFGMDDGQDVIGYGYYPVSIDGDASLDTTHQGSQYMRIDLGAPGTARITSDLDGTELDLHVIEEGDIDDVLRPIAFVFEDIDVGDVNPFYVLPAASGRPVCQAIVTFQVASDTPSICDVRDIDAFDGGANKEFGWFEVEGVSAGTCTYTVTYPNGNGGQGVSQQFTFEIEP